MESIHAETSSLSSCHLSQHVSNPEKKKLLRSIVNTHLSSPSLHIINKINTMKGDFGQKAKKMFWKSEAHGERRKYSALLVLAGGD